MSWLASNKTNKILLLLACMVTGACSTGYMLSTTPPKADIFEGDKLIGKSPMFIDFSDLSNEMAGGHLLKINHPGFDTVHVWVPKGVRGASVTVNLQPFNSNVAEGVSEFALKPSQINEMTTKMLASQLSLLLKEDKPLDIKLDQPEYRDIGSVYWLFSLQEINQGNNQKAISLLRDAIRLSPKEVDFYIVYNQIGGDPDKIFAGGQK